MATAAATIVIRALDKTAPMFLVLDAVFGWLIQAGERDRILRGELVAPTGRDLSEEYDNER